MSDLARRPDLPVVEFTVYGEPVEERPPGPDWLLIALAVVLTVPFIALILSLTR